MSETRSDLWPANVALISCDTPAVVVNWLRDQRLITHDEHLVHLDRAGEGNMNCTLRATIENETGHRRSVIVKQARPWVEKYPSIAAPVERSWYEARFYQCIHRESSVWSCMPEMLAQDPLNYVIALQDLIAATDMTDCYSGIALPLQSAAEWLGCLHAIHLSDLERQQFQNSQLRRLNHQHIFMIPFADEVPVDLHSITPGLESLRQELIADRRIQQAAVAMGEQYLDPRGADDPRSCLLHGDYYPGSFMHVATENVSSGASAIESFYVIDPEFCFIGPREFDLGVLLAHAVFCGFDLDSATNQIMSHYAPTDSSIPNVHRETWLRFAGFEILRRLLGVAQLPLRSSLESKQHWIEIAKHCILEPHP